MDDDAKFGRAAAELRSRRHAEIIEKTRREGNARVAWDGIEDDDGNPVGVQRYEFGACFLDDEPDPECN